jgi:hypothetical protein
MSQMKFRILGGCVLAALRVLGADIQATSPEEFRAAVARAVPGTRILLAGGVYGGGFHFSNLRGEPGHPIVIAALNPQEPPIFRDANTGLQLSNPAFVELHNLAFTHLADNGLNIDDGGTGTTPGSTHDVVIRGLRVADIGSDGNHDGIKLSGVWDFTVRDCTIERWGTKGGSAIDMVGCHRGHIEANLLRHTDPEPPNCTGVQCKGGSSEIAIRRNRFEHAGGRAVNIGGSTGRPYFRPTLVNGEEHAEARDIRVEGNTFIGAVTPVAFVGVDHAIVRFNTIERPGRWALRILQENKEPGFVPCRRGEFTDNVIVFDAAQWAEGGVNVGPGVASETFTFARNWWYCISDAERSRPRLPVPETDGVYGRSPEAAKGRAGADAWRE